MYSIENYLQEIGFSPSEGILYLAGLKLGKTGVNGLIKYTGMKRPTAYHALNELVAKGLADETKVGRELVYVMCPPSDIAGFIHSKIGNLSAQERKLEQFLPLFPVHSVLPDTELSVYQYAGEEGVRRLIDMALYSRTKRWDVIVPKDNFITSSDIVYIQYFKKTWRAQEIMARSLWEEKPSVRQLNLRDILGQKLQQLPKECRGRFTSMMILFDDSIAMISSYEQQEGLLIQSKEYCDLLTILFEGFWNKAEKS